MGRTHGTSHGTTVPCASHRPMGCSWQPMGGPWTTHGISRRAVPRIYTDRRFPPRNNTAPSYLKHTNYAIWCKAVSRWSTQEQQHCKQLNCWYTLLVIRRERHPRLGRNFFKRSAEEYTAVYMYNFYSHSSTTTYAYTIDTQQC